MQLDKECPPDGTRGRGRPGRDPDDELAVADQQRLGLRVEPDRRTPSRSAKT
jgi:hypothetical protein